jgi:hypothetical protein
VRSIQWQLEWWEPSEHLLEHKKTKIPWKTNRYSPAKHNHVILFRNDYMFGLKNHNQATITNTLSNVQYSAVQIMLVVCGPT